MAIPHLANTGLTKNVPWYERSMAQLDKYLPFLRAKKSPLPRSTLVITSVYPKKQRVVGDWHATWTMDFSGEVTIYVQEKFWKALVAAGLEFELVHTLQHEWLEAKLALKLARQKYPEANPYVMAEKDEDLGGRAHYMAIKELDGVSPIAYDRASSFVFKLAKI